MQIDLRTGVSFLRRPGVAIGFAVFVLPYLVIYCSGLPQWSGRTIAMAIPVSLLTAGPFWYAFTRDSRMFEPVIRPGATRARRIRSFEKFMRAFGFAFGILFTSVITVPFVQDLMKLGNGGPDTIVAQVAAVSGLIVGIPLIKQSIYFPAGERAASKSFTYLYALQPVKAGKMYEFKVLPHSRTIVDARQLATE